MELLAITGLLATISRCSTARQQIKLFLDNLTANQVLCFALICPKATAQVTACLASGQQSNVSQST